MIYPARLNIRLNPILWEDSPLRTDPSLGFKQVTTALSRSRYSANAREFLTSPPITQVLVPYRSLPGVAVLRVRNGVRVEDVVDTIARMRACASKKLGPNPPNVIAVYRVRDV